MSATTLRHATVVGNMMKVFLACFLVGSVILMYISMVHRGPSLSKGFPSSSAVQVKAANLSRCSQALKTVNLKDIENTKNFSAVSISKINEKDPSFIRWDDYAEKQLAALRTVYNAESVWNYCWMNKNFFASLNISDEGNSTKLNGFKPIIKSCEPVFLRLETGLGHGGDIVQAWVTGPSRVRPETFDMRNGTYVIFFMLFDSGSYTVNISLRWRYCRAYVLCEIEDTVQPIVPILSKNLTVLENTECDSESPLPLAFTRICTMGTFTETLTKPAFGTHFLDLQETTARWVKPASQQKKGIHSILNGKYVWSTFIENDGNDIEFFPLEQLKGKFIYFIGDSLSEHSFNHLVFEVLKCNSSSDRHLLVSRFDGTLLEVQHKRDGMQLVHCHKINTTLGYTFYPDYFPAGGSKEPRFPLVNQTANTIEELRNVSFGVSHWKHLLEQAMVNAQEIPAHTNPAAVIYNFGLHFATQLDPPLYYILLRHQFLTLMQEFPGLPILWRSTGFTHFEEKHLPSKWNCRTPVRIQILNEISDKLANALGLHTIDFQKLTAARPDATPDNRHYSLDNVRASYNSLLLTKLAEILGQR